MATRLDQKRRVVLPRDVTEELGVKEGTARLSSKRRKGEIILKRAEKKEDTLYKVMSWNPKRKGKLRPVVEEEMKEIWH